MTNFSAHSVTIAEIKDLIDHLDEWTQPQPINTPIGRMFFI